MNAYCLLIITDYKRRLFQGAVSQYDWEEPSEYGEEQFMVSVIMWVFRAIVKTLDSLSDLGNTGGF